MNDAVLGEVMDPAPTGTQIAEFTRTDQALAILDQRLARVTYDFTKGGELQRAIKDRAEVRGYRTDLERTRKTVKEDALALCRRIDGEAKRLESRLRDLEDPIDAQIKAEEERKEREREAREAAERERVQAIQNRIAWFTETAHSCTGMSSVDVLAAITAVEESPVDATFAEFQDQARGARDRALTMMRQMHAGALSLEAAAHAEERRQKEEAEQLVRERAALERAKAEQATRDLEERRRREALDAEEAERRAKIAADERAAQDRRDAAEREHRAKMEAEARAAQEAREARELVEREAMDRRRAEQAAEAKRIDEERAKLDAERRETERQAQELMDARTILSRFSERFGRRKEFAGVVAAIKIYFDQTKEK